MAKGDYDRSHNRPRGPESKRNPVRTLFERYASKAPVNVPGPQRSADMAYRDIKYLLLPHEQSALSVARGHAVDVKEGRQEFDNVCAEIRKRLFGV